MIQRKILLAFVSLLLWGAPYCHAWTSADEAAFQKANQAYRSERYADAVSLYEGLIEKYPDLATLRYNLGNAQYRLGRVGLAHLAYERALTLAPRHQDTRHNLRFLRGLSEYRIQDKRNWYLRAGDHVLRYFTENEVYLLALVAYLLLAGSWAFVLFFRRGLPWGAVRKGFLLAAGIAAFLAFAKNVQMHVIRDAIVLEREMEVRYGPSDTDRVAFRLGEGLKVHVVDRREDWSRILLVNGESGWVRDHEIGLVHR